MNRADLLQYALRDGKWHSRQEIQREVGYFLTNNAASELRRRGSQVEHKRDGKLDLYRLIPQGPARNSAPVSGLPQAGASLTPLSLAPAPSSATEPGDALGTDEPDVAVTSDPVASVAEQLPLYREPRPGAYAA